MPVSSTKTLLGSATSAGTLTRKHVRGGESLPSLHQPMLKMPTGCNDSPNACPAPLAIPSIIRRHLIQFTPNQCEIFQYGSRCIRPFKMLRQVVCNDGNRRKWPKQVHARGTAASVASTFQTLAASSSASSASRNSISRQMQFSSHSGDEIGHHSSARDGAITLSPTCCNLLPSNSESPEKNYGPIPASVGALSTNRQSRLWQKLSNPKTIGQAK